MLFASFAEIGLGLACTTTKPCKDVNADCKGNCTCKQSFYKDTICKPRMCIFSYFKSRNKAPNPWIVICRKSK